MRDFSVKNIIRILKSLTKDEDSNSMEWKRREHFGAWLINTSPKKKDGLERPVVLFILISHISL